MRLLFFDVYEKVFDQIDLVTNIKSVPNNKKDALVNVKFDNLPVVENKK